MSDKQLTFKVGDRVKIEGDDTGTIEQVLIGEGWRSVFIVRPDDGSRPFPSDGGELLRISANEIDASGSMPSIWHSTAALYARFGVVPDFDNTRRVFMEEVLEFVTEHVLHEQDRDNDANVTEEAADVLVTLIGMLIPVTTLESFGGAIQRVIAKNDAKTLDTHEVNRAGKIARKEATQP